MMTIPVAHWADEMMIRLPGASPAGCQQAFRGAFVEFCTKSGAWVRECAPMDAVADQVKYVVNPGADAEVLYIVAVSWTKEGTDRTFLHALQAPYRGRRLTQASDQPFGFLGSYEKLGEFELVPHAKETVADALTPWVCIRPPVGSFFEEVPEFVAGAFYEEVLDGAIGRMMVQQGKPYSNQAGAMYHLKRFRIGISTARDVARRQFTSAEASFVFPFWAGRNYHHRN